MAGTNPAVVAVFARALTTFSQPAGSELPFPVLAVGGGSTPFVTPLLNYTGIDPGDQWGSGGTSDPSGWGVRRVAASSCGPSHRVQVARFR